MAALTKKRISTLTKPGLHKDGQMPTLYLAVADGGSKSWIQRVTVRGKRRDIGLGGWPVVSIAEARDLAFKDRRIARHGGDPLAARRKAAMPRARRARQAVLTWRDRRQAHVERRAKGENALIGAPARDSRAASVLRVFASPKLKTPQIASRAR